MSTWYKLVTVVLMMLHDKLLLVDTNMFYISTYRVNLASALLRLGTIPIPSRSTSFTYNNSHLRHIVPVAPVV